MFRQFTIILITVLIAPVIYALDRTKATTQYAHDVWQEASGLPQAGVHSIVQTPDGYIWLSTQEGFSRFDGISFTTFTKRTVNELTNNFISNLIVQDDGTLWITSLNELLSYSHDRFQLFSTDTHPPQYFSGISIKGAHQSFWFKPMKGDWFKIDLLHKTLIPPPAFLQHETITTIFEDTAGTWFATTNGAYFVSPTKTIHLTKENGLPSNLVDAIYVAHDRSLWVGTRKGYFVQSDHSFRTVTRPSWFHGNYIGVFCEDTNGVMWISTESVGLIRDDHGILSTYSVSDGLSSNRVLSMMFDKEGSLWIGTSDGGLNRLHDTKLTPYGFHEGLPNSQVLSVTELHDSTKVFGTTTNGIAFYKNRQWHYVPTDRGIAPASVAVLCEDSMHALWIGTGGSGLLKYEHGTVKQMYTTQNGLLDMKVKCLLFDRLGRLWIGTNKGIQYLAHGVLTTVPLPPVDSYVYYPLYFHEDRTGTIWAAMTIGVLALHNGSVQSYSLNNKHVMDIVFVIHETQNGDLWFGTRNGLVRKRGTTFRSYSTADGLYDDVVFNMKEDDRGYFWMSSNNGISCIPNEQFDQYDQKKIPALQPSIFNAADGMPSKECFGGTQSTAIKDRSGVLWFPTVNGVVSIDPSHINVNTYVPPVYIYQVKADDKLLSPDSTYVLPPSTSNIELSYTALSYISSKQIQFKYMLEGMDKRWIAAGTRRGVSYDHLPYGTYTFHVIACNADGVWNMKGDSFRFTISAPFWATTWFKILESLTGIAMIAGIIYLIQIRTLRKKIRLLEQQRMLDRERMRISKDMHDEVGSNLTKISILSEIAKRTKNDQVYSHLDTISRTSREVIDNISQIIWAMNPQHDTLDSMFAYIRSYISESAELLNIPVVFTVPDVISNVQVRSEFRRNIFLVIKEAINNALKHAEATQLTFGMNVQQQMLTVEFSDNGKGFLPSDVSRFSNGLSNMQRRIEDLHGTLTITAAPGQGTRMLIHVPLTTNV